MLLERDDELASLTSAGASVGHQPGRVIAVTGDAGAGKSALVRVACEQVSARLARGLCDPLSTPRPLGPVRDALRDVRATVAPPTDRGDSLVRYSEDAVAALGAEPTVLVVEDAQWIDEASIDVLRFLVRRIEAHPILLVVIYRDDEIDAGHLLRPLLGDIARFEHAVTIHLDPLSVAGVSTLLEGTGLDPATVHDATGGNPFYVSEIARHPAEGVPPSVRDAVLASTSGLAPRDVQLLQLLAAAPDGIDHRLLPALHIDLPTLRRLDATGLLARDARSVRFRHELGRLAVEGSVPPAGLPRLHERLLDALEQLDGADLAVLCHHAVAAGDRVRAGRYARKAAEEAASTGSHTEAASFFALAVGQLDLVPLVERARLHERLAFEQYMTNRLPDAIDSVDVALKLWAESGDHDGLAAAHSRRAQFEYYSARRHEAEDHVRRAALIAADDEPRVPYGMALSMRGYLAFRQNDLERASACNAEALALADRLDAHEIRLQSAIVDRMAEVASGSLDARPSVQELIDEARLRSMDEVASMGMSNLVTTEIEQRRYRAAEDLLESSLPFTVERDIAICNQVQLGQRCRLHLGRGRWQAALEDAATVIDAGGAPLAQVWPHIVSALIPLRCGSTTAPDGHSIDAHLEAAWTLALELDEPAVTLPVLGALIERGWLAGDDDQRVEAVPRLLQGLGARAAMMWSVGDVLVWYDRAGGEVDGNYPVAEPHALVLAGRYADAAVAWREIGDPFEEAMALVLLDGADEQASGLHLLEQMGATATADRCRQDLRRRGFTSVPSRRRASTRANPAGLTNRQLDVARLLAKGLTNAELAQRLFISEKTADHHVSAVLAKLQLSSRREVSKHATALGLA